MASEAWDILTVDDDWLVELCKKAEAEGAHVGGFKGGVAVLKTNYPMKSL